MESKMRERYYGLYKGKVVKSNDPQKRNRLKVIIPQVLGDNVTGWIEPCLPVTLLPDLDGIDTTGPAHITIKSKGLKAGDKVWIMFEAGDPDFPVWVGVLP
jgi:hypothetical protein